ncbi:MAG: asparagine synthase (glutamine-hydrolyzing) [Candidatus Diapherotrites archaeon]|nr:asparagine synthase (glutamine-hydrolyzing) [Candidatus Diapherotrites archaeon]
MCGINGFSWEDKALVKKMNDAIAHRGPDGEGIFVDRVSLGHRRLKIIDLSDKAKQPMANEDNSIWIVFNGEIYNYRELRKELEAKGHGFKSDSDTEVILHAYEEFGHDCLGKFRGMWAFAIYDSAKRQFFLARDYFGIKPLYYYWDGEKFIFSSEIKGILRHGVERKINRSALELYLHQACPHETGTVFENVFKVPPSHSLVLDIAGKTLSLKRFYDIGAFAEKSFSKKELLSKGRILLDKACSLSEVADVEVGVFLSGGLDSSAVLSTMKKLNPDAGIKSFSIYFEDNALDESEYIEAAAGHFGTDHHSRYLSENDFVEAFGKIYHYCDEPLTNGSLVPLFLLSETAKEKVSVCLAGEGGDEFFGAYPRHHKFYRMDYFMRHRLFSKAALSAFNALSLPFGKNFCHSLRSELKASMLPADWIQAAVSRQRRPDGFVSGQRLAELEKMHSGFMESNGFLDSIRLVDISSNFVTRYLASSDRMSMAHGLELRPSLLDRELFEFSKSIPNDWKFSFIRGNKPFFREMLSDRLPEKTVKRRAKTGLGSPVDKYLSGSLKGVFEDKILSLKRSGLVEKGLAEDALDCLRKGTNFSRAFAFAALEDWREKWLPG